MLVKRTKAVALPELDADRIIERVVEVIQLSQCPEQFAAFPAWTQRVMNILKDQLIPPEFVEILAAGQSVFAEGVSAAWIAAGQDFLRASERGGQPLAQKLVDRLAKTAGGKDVMAWIESQEFIASQDFQKYVMKRLFADDLRVRRAFAEGLAVGNRLHELIDQQTRRRTTDATGIYLMLWLYWPEIEALRSVSEVARALEPFLAKTKNQAGSHWEERIRKLANRIELSFRSKQRRLGSS